MLIHGILILHKIMKLCYINIKVIMKLIKLPKLFIKKIYGVLHNVNYL